LKPIGEGNETRCWVVTRFTRVWIETPRAAATDLDVAVTRVATLRVDCHKMDGDWSLLQYRAGLPPGGRKDAGQWQLLENQPAQTGHKRMVPTSSPINEESTAYRKTLQADRLPSGWESPTGGVLGQMVPSHLLTARETAGLLRTSERTLYNMTESGDIQAARFGRAVRYDPDAVMQWIEQHSKKAGE
jgi:excisionase family DNA binding protein